jgi:hypothetical protein
VVASEGRERTQGAVVSASTLRARFPPTHLYQEQAQQLKHQIDRAERAEQSIELERVKTTMAEVALANMEQDYLRERECTLIANKALWDEVKERRRREEAGLEEDEPEETHWDKGTQTEDVILKQDLPPKKRRIQTEESP